MSLRLPAATMQTLAQLSPDAIIGVDTDGCVDLWSDAAERLFGIQSYDAIGKPLPASIASIETLGTEAGVSQIAVNAAGETLELELRHAPRKAGDAPGGWVLLAIDRRRFLEREREAHEMLRYERRFRELLEAAPDGILEVDRGGTIILVNRVAEALFGYTREELIGMNVDVLVPDALGVLENVEIGR